MKRLLALLVTLLTIGVLQVVYPDIIGRGTVSAEPQRQQAAPDPDVVKVDPNHYKLEFENETIRVLRITYGPHEKSPMHSHPATVSVTLKAAEHTRATFPDGKSEESKGDSVGAVSSDSAVTHAVENLSDKPIEGILIELKGKDKPKQATPQ